MSAQGGVSIARSRNGDRFYSPPAVRKHRQQKLLQQQQKEQQHELNEKEKEKDFSSSVDSEKVSEDSLSTTSSMADSVCSISRPAIDCSTNLDRFLRNTTPVVAAQCLSKASARGRKPRVKDSPSYFILDDLWESFKEWSAYGAGVPILLNANESVVQYYVPSLSAIQLFVDPSRPSFELSKRAVEDSDVGSYRETSSEGSCDRDAERGDISHNNRSRGLHNVTDSDIQSINRLSLINKTCVDASSSEGDIHSTSSTVVFEFFERESPFIREPLANKISILASRFPGLKTLRSCDLLPQSWLSVAWYPIYRIPTGPTLQNVDACFLTYHSLSTPLSSKDVGASQAQNSRVGELHHLSTSSKLSLPTFALASYRFKACVWESDCQKEQLLLQEAGNWLKLRQVEHPDYRFFITNYVSPLLRR